MITTQGKAFFKRGLAGQGGIVGALAIGIGNTAASLNDTKLQFEFARIPVDLTAFDFQNDKLIFKGTLPEEVGGRIYEVGIFTLQDNPAAGVGNNRIITTFDSDTEDWGASAAYVSATHRIGSDALVATPAASATTSLILSNLGIDLSDSLSSDTFTLAYNVDNANTATVRLRFRTNATNYYEYVISNPTTGYKLQAFTKGSLTVVGTPDWLDINEIEIQVVATSGGAASVWFDGLRIDDTTSVTPEYGLVARFVVSPEVIKSEGVEFDIEYALGVTA